MSAASVSVPTINCTRPSPATDDGSNATVTESAPDTAGACVASQRARSRSAPVSGERESCARSTHSSAACSTGARRCASAAVSPPNVERFLEQRRANLECAARREVLAEGGASLRILRAAARRDVIERLRARDLSRNNSESARATTSAVSVAGPGLRADKRCGEAQREQCEPCESRAERPGGQWRMRIGG